MFIVIELSSLRTLHRAEMAGQVKRNNVIPPARTEQTHREKARQTFDTTGKVVQFLGPCQYCYKIKHHIHRINI